MIENQVDSFLPTVFGNFNLIAFSTTENDPMPHLAIVQPDLDVSQPVLVRIHSECLTGDILGSKRCDCGQQLHKALHLIEQEKGVLLYLRQEGRGIGLINKLKAYNLQDQGFDTVDANLHLGFQTDQRNYEVAQTILNNLHISQIRLLTNNPKKVEFFEGSAIRVIERVPLIIEPNRDNEAYLKTKKNKLGHLF